MPKIRLLWPIMLLLAAFVIFFEFIADVGGSAEPLPSPPVVTPTATFTPDEQAPPEPNQSNESSPGPPITPPGRSVD